MREDEALNWPRNRESVESGALKSSTNGRSGETSNVVPCVRVTVIVRPATVCDTEE